MDQRTHEQPWEEGIYTVSEEEVMGSPIEYFGWDAVVPGKI